MLIAAFQAFNIFSARINYQLSGSLTAQQSVKCMLMSHMNINLNYYPLLQSLPFNPTRFVLIGHWGNH